MINWVNNMKMVLKNKAKHKLKIDLFNKKTYFIFLISLFVVSVVIGIIFFTALNNSSKDEIVTEVNSYFKVSSSYNYLKILLDNLKNNFLNCFLIWILGISIIGVFIIIFLYFMEGFSIGFIIAAIFSSYKYKGIIGSLLYLFPSKIIYLLIMFILTFFSVKFSYSLTKNIIKKEEISLNIVFKKYLKILGVCLIFSFLCSLLETFINPFMIKAFTFLVK